MSEPMAIIGSACRFPGNSTSPSKLWELLREPRDVISSLSVDRLNLARFYNHNGEHHGSTDVRGQSYLLAEDYRHFDAAFFNISPLEADGMDPQQRILLETVYEALEAAGCSLESMSGTMTSVHVGVMNGDYNDIQMRDPETLANYHATATSRSILSNRISYFFNLHGPSVTVDTACSSSLVALHQAVQALQLGDATSAIVAGSNLILDAGLFIAESTLHMLSPDSRSRMWDKSANGYARGEGFAAILLKPLSRAIADGDNIDAVIRGTGVNSDGRTAGITMPSAAAQTALIEHTYRKAGLDPIVDRCQYFECHGTGTSAGDPVEARAIVDAFFPTDKDESGYSPANASDRLFVGSIKTVVGHLEGCAGLAGVLKAVLAIKNRTIPPNMHFKELNPAIEPFYHHLEIPTKAIPWPEIGSAPLRVSVNSFGFGGTNSHAILESYDGDEDESSLPKEGQTPADDEPFLGPLILSANSDASLVSAVKSYAEAIKSSPSLNLEDLAWTLQFRRSMLPVKAFFSGATRQRLLNFMDRFVSDATASPDAAAGVRTQLINPGETPGILGVFTGQGAQWASMGRGLILASPIFQASIERCEAALTKLSDGPSWSLKEEIMADAANSRISEAELSQPLCTALQIALVDLLRMAGIKLDAFVGHSSGEIAAVYAAGIIDAEAAMQIAYYRGYHAKLAQGAQGQQGRMMAVGITYDDAQEFCSRSEFAGRVVVAASNSPLSVTLSGDIDAIEEAKDYFDSQKTFARLLKTDTAYHSHHMLPCAEPYLRSLKACDIRVNRPRSDCIWISSVRGDVDLLDGNLSCLSGQYWVDNMCNPVLFSQAIETSLWNGGPFDVAVEIGPHPALKGPSEQTFKASFGHAPGYAGTMRRGDPEVEALSGAVGYVWSRLGPGSVDFDGYRRAFQGPKPRKPRLIKDLPSYSWDHSRVHWKESRISRKYRLRQDQSQELLGRRVPDDLDDNMRWRNILRLSEIAWLRGHVFQGQVLFPGAGYVAMALEAANAIAGEREVRLFELEDIVLSRAMVISDRPDGIETVVTARIVDQNLKSNDVDQMEVEFACYFCSDESSEMSKACAGRMFIHYGSMSFDALPSRLPPRPDLVPVDMARFYSAMNHVGLDYDGVFHGMLEGNRAMGSASVTASWPASSMSDEYIMHPGFLDVAFQSLYVAFSSPSSGDIWAPYLPVRIRRLAVNPNVGYLTASGEIEMEADALVSKGTSTLLEGDIHLYDSKSNSTGLQVEGIAMQAMSEPSPDNDKNIFSETVWEMDISCGLAALDAVRARMGDDLPLVEVLDRTSLYYWRELLRDIEPDEIEQLKWYHQRMFDAINYQLTSVRDGQHPVAKRVWLDDSYDDIITINKPYESRVDLRLIHAVGKNLASVVRGQTQLLEVMLEDDMLNRFYMEGYGFSVVNDAISATVKQIIHKYPQASILEIGAGTGGTTRSILDKIGSRFSSYTYTDISPAFFNNAANKFRDHEDKMNFTVLDIEKDVVSQGFSENSYDMIIAANVLHATRELHKTMQHVRSLLRPGGYLVMMEVTGPHILRTQFIMGGLPGWWYGIDDGRVLSPAISVPDWDELLQNTGFSGVDHVLHDMCNEAKHSFSLIVSQAVNDQVQMLRDPLTSIGKLPADERTILIIGGRTLPVARAIREIQKCFSPWGVCVSVAKSIDCVESEGLPPMTSIICMQELDQPLFLQGFEASQLKSLQDLFLRAKHLVWVSHGRTGESPHACMTLGIGRALLTEMPNVALQFLDIDVVKSPSASAQTILGVFLQLIFSSQPGDGDERLLWTTEPEILYDNGQRFIPRVLPSTRMNNTYNSARRLITKEVCTEETGVELVGSDDNFRLLEMDMDLHRDPPTGNVRLRVLYSLQVPANDEQSYYVCCGYIMNTGHGALALSTSNASVVEVDEALVVELKSTNECCPALLQAVVDNLLAHSILTTTGQNRQVVVYEPGEGVATILSSEERVLLASSRQEGIPQGWIALHPMLSQRELQRRLPSDLGCFAHFSDALCPRLRACLPSDCPIMQCTVSHIDPQMLQSAFLAAVSGVPPCRSLETIRVQDLSLQRSIAAAKFPVTDWTDTTYMEVAIRPLNTTSLLSRNCTYLLAGMTGQLGLSLCRWMVQNGARHIALTSRTPDVSHVWIESMRELGANIQIFKADITDRAAVLSLVQDIENSMPPISGVCNACMVLSDKLFLDMDIETLNNTLKPKVDGSRYLDEVFYNRHLDFFMMFSSLASVIGNAGQSNYHAANLFMAGLAAQRRHRGLAASVMHIGLVTDVGYVARQGQAMEERLRKLYFLPLSESDIHHSFAEAIFAGKPDSGRHPEIIIGLQDFEDRPDNHSRPPWEHNPRFSHFVTRTSPRTRKASAELGTVSIKQALTEVDAREVAIELVQRAFSRKLEVMMQLPPNSVNINVPLIDLGCDSLLAIEIRGWFLKELGMDVPVLKVLSGDTVAQLCEEATKNYLAVKYSEAPGKGSQKLDGVERPTVDECILGRRSVHSEQSEEIDSVGMKDGHTVNDASSDSPFIDESAESSMGTSIDGLDTPNSIPPAPCPGDSNFGSAGSSEEMKINHTERASFAQSRLWFLMKYLEDSTTYNVTVSYEVTGGLQISRLRRAVATAVSHHDCLRSCFFEQTETGFLMQGVMSSPSYVFNHITSSDAMVVKSEYEQMKQRVWNLSKGEIFGVTVVSQSANRHVVIFGYHHIIMDGMSWHIFLRDLDAAYQMRPLASSRKKYVDFSREQILSAENSRFAPELEFWLQEHHPLPAVMPLLPLANVTTRDALQTYDSHVVSREIDRELLMTIKRVSQKLRVTPFHFHLAVIQVIFARLLDLDDLCLGIADANRTNDHYADTVGIFLNLLPVRFQLQTDQSFGDLAKATSQKMFAAISNSKVPFDLVLDALKVPRSADHTPLFQVAVNYRMGALLQRPLGDCMLNIASADDAKNPYDINFGITETTFGSALFELTTQERLYSRDASERLMDMYFNLLMAFSADDSIRIRDAPLVNQAQLDSAIIQGRGRRMEFGWPTDLYGRFDEMRITYASNIAIRDSVTALTYSQLAAKIDNIAALLLATDLGPGSTVAVLCQPSSDSIACMLAILRIGCVYLPLDTRLPRSRHLSMIDDSTPAAILLHHDTEDLAFDLLSSCRVPPVLVDLNSPAPRGENGRISVRHTAPAFLLYTSGSTGVPKGIVLSQSSFLNHIAAKTELLSIGREVVLQQSSLGFDMSIIQIFCALANGGTLVIAPREVRGDPVELSKLMSKEGVTFTIATPSEYLMMLRYGSEHLRGLSSWRQACTGGEAVTRQLVQAFQSLQRPSMTLTNCYGPTEITAAATFQNVSLDPGVAGTQDCACLVGKALPNYSVYIFDENGRPQPFGVDGEICIGGAGVAMGYLNLPDQTASKFVQDPHASPEDIAKGWSTMYRTGDKGRLLEDGTLVFMGRLDGDNQVKVNGIRIELDEVANILLRTGQGLISDVVVTVRGEPAFLVAHAVLAPEKDTSATELRQLIANLPLPKYMHPSMIVPLERLPINSNGKVDRIAIAALPLPQQETQPGSTKRLTLREGELRLLWEQVLPTSGHASRLEPESDFFMHGGNSMLLVQLQGAIKEAIGVNVAITELYQASTLCRMAACISSRKEQQPQSDEQVDWASETTVPRSIITMAQASREGRNILHGGREVLLTGSTTFLGSAILASLIEDPNVEKVHCIAVSPQDQARLPSSDKVSAYTGSLLTANLGLSDADCSKLKSTIHVIIHAGAHGHCLNNYSSLRVPNLHSTRFLVSLALSHSIPIHFLSSNRVTLLSGELEMPPASASTYLPNKDGSEGFTASKWASEVFLENVCRQTGLEICVHRACAVTGDKAPNEDALNALLKYTRLLRCVPRFENFQGYLDFKDVHGVAAGIVKEALQMAEPGASPRFVHHSSGKKVPVHEFRQHMEDTDGSCYEQVSVGEWIDRATEAGIDPLITGYLESMTQKGEVIRFPYMGKTAE